MAFEKANKHQVELTAIAGGLFIDERAQSLKSYPHIPEANRRIAHMTGAVFGEEYNAQLETGTIVMNSLEAGAGMAVLRGHAPERAIYWAHEL